MKRKALVLLLALMMVVQFSSCSQPAATTEPTSNQQTTSPTQTSEATTSNPTPWFHVYSPAITLTTEYVVTADSIFQEGDDAGNNGMTRWMEKACGIKWEALWTAPSEETEGQKLDLAAASGELPDVFNVNSNRIGKLISAGLVTPIDELIEKYASPLYKWMIEDAQTATRDTFFNPFKNAGKTYAMPAASDTLVWWKTTFIRKDILDALGKKVPETLADLEDVLAAYHAKYPDGIGLGMSNEMSADVMQIEVVTSAYGAYPKSWIKGPDGTVVYGGIQPEMKAALETLNKWYNNGWIDKEFAVKNADKLNEDTAKGNVLVYKGMWWNVGYPFPDLWTNVPNSEMVVMPYLKGPDGKQGIAINPSFGNGRAISSKCKNPEAVVYLYNEVLDSALRSYTDLRDKMKGQGYEFKYPVTEIRVPINKAEADAKYGGSASSMYKYDYPEEIVGYNYFNDFSIDASALGFTGKPVSIASKDFEDMANAVTNNTTDQLSYTAKQMLSDWNSTNPKMATTFAAIYQYWNDLKNSDALVISSYQGGPSQNMIDKQTYLDKIEIETYMRIIMGDLPISAFDQFITDWKTNGGDDITKEVNDWYKSVN